MHARTTLASLLIASSVSTVALAAGTRFFEQTTPADFSQGTTQNVVVTSFGEIRLGRALEPIAGVNTPSQLVEAVAHFGNATLIAASLPGRLIAVENGTSTPLIELGEADSVLSLLVADTAAYAGTGGSTAKVYKVAAGTNKADAIATLADSNYVWSLAKTSAGKLLAATGPNGKLFEIDPNSGAVRELFDSTQNNLLAVRVVGDLAYVGSDPDGLLFEIDLKTGQAKVVFDAVETEIAAIVADPAGGVFFATRQHVEAMDDASAEPTPVRRMRADRRGSRIDGEPVEPPAPPTPPGEDEPIPGPDMQVPVEPPAPPADNAEMPISLPGELVPGDVDLSAESAEGNSVYRLDPAGFVTRVWTGPAMVFDMILEGEKLLLATGPGGKLLEVDPLTLEESTVLTVDTAEVVALAAADDDSVIVAGSTPSGVGRLSSKLAESGTFISGVLDASQISRFGKLRLEGTLPTGTTIRVSIRSSNNADPDGDGWSDWTPPVPASRFVDAPVPAARFAQYKLELAGDGHATPSVDFVALAYQQPNLPPAIDSLDVARPTVDSPMPVRNVTWSSTEPNGDELRFDVFVRPAGGDWLKVGSDLVEPSYEWNTQLLPDGRYEIKVEASDRISNPAGTARIARRVSGLVLVDNTPPVIGDIETSQINGTTVLKFRVADRSGLVMRAEYLTGATGDWQTLLPVDILNDSPDERYELIVPTNKSGGSTVVSIRAADESGNVAHASVTVRAKE